MNNNRIEQRTLSAATFKIREAQEGESESRIIEGYAIRFNEKSQVLCDWWDGYFREVINPAACTKEFLDRQDIKLTMYHNREKVLARSNKGVGTLHYEVREDGVFMWAEMPRTQFGDECLELVKRGDLQGMSFAFRDGQNAGSITWTEDEDGIPLRTVNEMEGIYDMTIAADPAYPTTSVEARECPSWQKREEDKEKERKEQEREQERRRRLYYLQFGY